MKAFLAATLLATALPAAAILIRPDRDDAEYLELATKYESAVWLEPVDSGGVLIAPRWILTLGLVAGDLRAMKPGAKLRIGKTEHAIESVFVSPRPGPEVGLVLLKTAVLDLTPTPLYRWDDEAGKGLVTVSQGPTGKMGEKEMRSDKRRRAGINTVEAAATPLLQVKVKALGDASDLQGVATDADRGSPGYIEGHDGVYVAAIAWVTNKAPAVGDDNLYLRVSPLVPWIEATMLDVAKKEVDSMLDPDRR